VTVLVAALTLFLRVLVWLIVIRALLSWVRLSGKFWYDLQRTLEALTEPVLAPIRNALPATPGVDLSPLIAIILLQVVERLVLGLLARL
jgi:YggT family protein